MSQDNAHEELLKTVLDRVIQNNQQLRPGTPLAELKDAIEAALTSLPPLEFEEFSQALDNTDVFQKLVRRAPEIIGWNADQVVAWVEELAKKL
jgi:hypothetical protein